jgi:WD repeat-containing protein 19
MILFIVGKSHSCHTQYSVLHLQKGKIYFFYMEDWSHVGEFDHSANTASRTVIGIRRLFADPSGTRLIYIDDKGDGFVYNPVLTARLF